MPYIVFDSADDHKKALEVFLEITLRNDGAPLENQVQGVNIKLDGRRDAVHAGVYILSKNYLAHLGEHDVKYTILSNTKALTTHLSVDGFQQLLHVQKYRSQDVERANN